MGYPKWYLETIGDLADWRSQYSSSTSYFPTDVSLFLFLFCLSRCYWEVAGKTKVSLPSYISLRTDAEYFNISLWDFL